MFDTKKWVRDFINDECIWRGTAGEPRLPGKLAGTTYGWQFYLRRAILDANCSYLIAEMFWDRYKDRVGAFQIAACESAGVPLACALQSYAKFKFRANVPVFTVKKEPKRYGLHNLTEGMIYPELPALIVDDLAGSQETFLKTFAILQASGVEVFDDYFAIVDKDVGGHRVYLEDRNLFSLYSCSEFDLSAEDYVKNTGRALSWHGKTVRVSPEALVDK